MNLFEKALGGLFSLLPLSVLNKLVAILSDTPQQSADLTDMRSCADNSGPYSYGGEELLHRDRGIASFEATSPWAKVRWGVTFDAVRDFDPQWGEMVGAMQRASDVLMAKANEIHAAGAFEPDGSVLVRNLKA